MAQQQQDAQQEIGTRYKENDDSRTICVVYFSKIHKQEFEVPSDEPVGKSLSNLVRDYAKKNNFRLMERVPLLAYGYSVSGETDTPDCFLGEELHTSYEHKACPVMNTTIQNNKGVQESKNPFYQLFTQIEVSLLEMVLIYLDWEGLSIVQNSHAHWRNLLSGNTELWNKLYKLHFKSTPKLVTTVPHSNAADMYKQRYWIKTRKMCPHCTATGTIDIIFYGIGNGFPPKGYYQGGCISSRNDSRCRLCQNSYYTFDYK